MKPLVLPAWAYADPLDVIEHVEDLQGRQIAAEQARALADSEIEAMRRASLRPLSPVTYRTMRRLRIRELMKART